MPEVHPKVKIIPHIQANTIQGGAIYNAMSRARPLLAGIPDSELNSLEIQIERSNGNGSPTIRFESSTKSVQDYLRKVEINYADLFRHYYLEYSK